jgi:hypothetical protein
VECEGTSWLEEDIQREVGTFFDELVVKRRVNRPIAGPLDSARFWLRIGEMLWDPDVRSRLSGLYFDETIRRMLIMLSGAWMDLKPEGWVQFSFTWTLEALGMAASIGMGSWRDQPGHIEISDSLSNKLRLRRFAQRVYEGKGGASP